MRGGEGDDMVHSLPALSSCSISRSISVIS
jgi:hypothetical protein